MWLEAVHSPAADEENCPSCGGGVCRRVYGEVYAGSFILDGIRVEIRKRPEVGYADPIYLDPLTQYFDGGLYRLWPSEKYLSRGGKTLHRAVWAMAFGPVPAGCHIHHRDGNPRNNLLANLECQPANEHLSQSWHDSRRHIEPGHYFTERAREAAAAWHRSEEGRLWHRRHAERSKSWTKHKREPRNCLQCGVEFMGITRKGVNQQVYCTTACKVAAYRARNRQWSADYRARKRAERTTEGRACRICGNHFVSIVSKNGRRHTCCSKPCVLEARRIDAREYQARLRARKKAERDG